jgi:hypothetical protein
MLQAGVSNSATRSPDRVAAISVSVKEVVAWVL